MATLLAKMSKLGTTVNDVEATVEACLATITPAAHGSGSGDSNVRLGALA